MSKSEQIKTVYERIKTDREKLIKALKEQLATAKDGGIGWNKIPELEHRLLVAETAGTKEKEIYDRQIEQAETQEKAIAAHNAAVAADHMAKLEAKALRSYLGAGGKPEDFPQAWEGMKADILKGEAMNSIRPEQDKQKANLPVPHF